MDETDKKKCDKCGDVKLRECACGQYFCDDCAMPGVEDYVFCSEYCLNRYGGGPVED